jgi:hypothetical protein
MRLIDGGLKFGRRPISMIIFSLGAYYGAKRLFITLLD